MDIFKMAEQIANGMSENDKSDMQGMNLEELMKKVSGSVFEHMKDMPGAAPPTGPVATKKKKKKKKKKKPKRTPDIDVDLSCELEDFYDGAQKSLRLKRPCGVDELEKVKLVVQVEPGMQEDHTVEFAGEAGDIDGWVSGDVHVTLVQNPHALFVRDGDDLIFDCDVSVSDTFDFKRKIRHIDGRIIELVSPKCILNVPMMKVANEGMPDGEGGRGDLYVRFQVMSSTEVETLTEEQKQVLATLFPPLEVPDNALESEATMILETPQWEDEDEDSDDGSDADSDDFDSDADDSDTVSDDTGGVDISDSTEDEGFDISQD